MKQIRLVLVLLLSFATISTVWTSVQGQEAEALLLFTRYDNQTESTSLYVLNADTREERLLIETESFYRAGWSPDGRIWVADSVDRNTDQGRIRFFDVETGEETILSESLVFNVDQCYPALLWSPDGQSLAYSTGIEDERVLNIDHRMNQSSYSLPFAAGEYLAYWSDDGAYIRIYGGQTDRLLAAEDGREILVAEDIQFSPDDRFVGYRENEVIWLYELATGERSSLEISGRIWAWFPTFILIRAEGSEILWRYDITTHELISLEISGRILASFPTFILLGAEGSEILWRYDIATHELISLEITGNVVSRSPDERYLVISDENAGGVVYLYDTQNNSLTPLDPGYPVRFVAWTAQESQMFLYADFEANEPQTLLRYDLASGGTETLFETSGSILSVEQRGDWLFIHYSPVVGDNTQARFLLRNLETGVELEVEMYYDLYLPSGFVSLSPDGHWLVLNADDGVYLFDMNGTSSELQLLATHTGLNYGVSTGWSGDSRYMAFNAEGQVHLLDVESGTIEILAGTLHEVIGWQYAGRPYVILCSGGSDGNA